MTVLIDTSALYALLDEDDDNHEKAAAWFRSERAANERLVTHNYVVVETTALVHRRLGAAAVRVLLDDIVPSTDQHFVDEALHRRAVAAYLAGIARRPSFVDRVSFEFMRDAAIREAFAFDRDFAGEGFRTVPR